MEHALVAPALPIKIEGMNSHRWMTGLLAATFFACEAALYHWTTGSASAWPHPASVAMLGIALAGLGLVSCWVIFGQANIAVRCSCLMLAQVLVAYLGSGTAAGRPASWSLAIGIFTACLLSGMLIGRCCRLTLRWESTDDPHSRSAMTYPLRPRQFTIWQLLSLTTAVATMLAFWTGQSVNWDVARQSFIFFGFLSCLAMASLWSGIRGRIGINVVLLAGGLAGASIWFHWMQYRGLNHVSLVSLALVMQTTLIASALILRTAGLRIATPPIPSDTSVFRSTFDANNVNA